MITKNVPTYGIHIYGSGPLAVAEQTCRRFCLEGLCVTISPTRFIYTGGEETGYCVNLLNYPRFPAEPDKLNDTAKRLALELLEDTYQHSILIVNPNEAIWFTKREQ